MSRHTKRSSDTGFAALTIEGGLIAPDQVQAIASAAPDQKTAADYGCPKGTGLRDEITRYFRIAQAHWQGYARLEQPTMQQTAEFARNLLEQAFGFELTGPHHHMREDRRFTIAWEAKGGRVPVVVAPSAPADKGKAGDGFARALPEFGDGADGRIARRSPTVLLQDWLNANPDFYWGLVFAGDRVRLMRDNASLTRPAWIEADLGAIFRDEMFADFAALWLLIHASRFGAEGAAASDCALERWREAGMRAGTSARERLRVNVEEALMALGQGILDANPAIRERLDTNQLTMPHLFEQMLRVVYRLIFLGVAEDRDLLHPPATPKAVRDLYSNNYGFAWARDRSTRRNAHDHHHDAWEGVKVTFRALERGERLLGLPALGGLFDRALTPDLDAAQIPNRALLAAAFKLGWLIEDGRRVRINWRDIATEELGSVYEGLLQLVPLREDEGRTFTFAGGEEARSNARKVSGSYYTPDSLVQRLLDSALDPVLERAEARGGAKAILELNVIDPACGSGHFLLGAARRMATRVAQLRNPDAPDYNAAMRDVVRNCIHGVDRNPMAIELAKVALWIESVEPGKPLGFLDANIQCGDSLLGVFNLKVLEEGIPDDAYKALTGDDKGSANGLRRLNRSERDAGLLRRAIAPEKLVERFDRFHAMPEASLTEISAKSRAFAEIKAGPDWWPLRVACDAYIAAFLLPKPKTVSSIDKVLVPTTRHVREALDRRPPQGSFAVAIDGAVSAASVFHWPLAFPEVMIGKGGFDVVLGNPPYISAMEQTRMGIEREREFWRYSKLSARGAFDIYVPFLELGLALSPHGRCSLLTPNKYLSAPYGEGLREVIRDTNSLDSIIDESRGDHFSDASVYPVITNFDARGSATRKEVFSIMPSEGGYLTISHDVNHLFALPNVNLGPLLSKNAPLLYRVLRQTIPLETICDVNASTTAGEADEFTVALYDAPTGISSDVWKVLNTGLIDPFRVRWGEQQLRHAKRIYQNPVFDRDASIIPSRRKEHYSSPKLIFAKLASHPEVFVDENGEYAGLNVNFAFIEGDSAYFIAAQLNSLIGDWLYRQLFGALAMSGGYLQYQAPQIRAWPIQIFDSRNPLHVDVVQIARGLQSNNIDADLDCAVAKCFGLSSNDLSAMTESLHTLSEAQAVEGDLE